MMLFRGRTAGVALFLGTRVVGVVGGLAALGVVSRFLGPSEFGVFATALAIAATLSGIADLGFSPVAMRQTVREPEHRRSYLRRAATARFLIGMTIYGLLVAVLTFTPLNNWSGRSVVLVCSAIVPLGYLQLYYSYLQRAGRFRLSSILSLCQTLAWLMSAIFLTKSGAGLLLLSIAQSCSVVAVMACAYGFFAYSERSRTECGNPTLGYRELFVEAIYVGASSIVSSVYYRLSSIVVLGLGGPTQAGYFGVASRFLDQAALLPNTLGAAFAPVVNQAARRGATSVSASARQYADYMMILAIPSSTICGIHSSLIIKSMFGVAFLPAAPALTALAATFVFVCLGWALTSAVIALSLSKRQLLVGAVVLPISGAAAVLFTSEMGATGAAYASLLTEVAVCCGLVMSIGKVAMRIIPLRRILTLFFATILTFVPVRLMEFDSLLTVAFHALALILTVAVLRLVKLKDLIIPDGS